LIAAPFSAANTPKAAARLTLKEDLKNLIGLNVKPLSFLHEEQKVAPLLG
jgi:hypothetical protein